MKGWEALCRNCNKYFMWMVVKQVVICPYCGTSYDVVYKGGKATHLTAINPMDFANDNEG